MAGWPSPRCLSLIAGLLALAPGAARAQSPDVVASAGVVLTDSEDPSVRFTGPTPTAPFSSSGLAVSRPTAGVENVDGSDGLGIVVLIENRSPRVLYDVGLAVALPNEIVSAGPLLVTDGAENSTSSFSGDLFAGTFVLTELAAFDATSGSNILRLRGFLRLDPEVTGAGDRFEVSVEVVSAAFSPGGANEIAAGARPAGSFEVQIDGFDVSTFRRGPPSAPLPESRPFRTTLVVPEGAHPQVRLDQTLAPGLALVGAPVASLPFGVTSTRADLTVGPNGESFTLDFGEILNLIDSESSEERIEVEFEAAPRNVASNQDGTRLITAPSLVYGAALTATSTGAELEVAVPEVTLDLAATTTAAEPGEVLGFELRLEGRGPGPAYDVRLEVTLPTGLANLEAGTGLGPPPDQTVRDGRRLELSWLRVEPGTAPEPRLQASLLEGRAPVTLTATVTWTTQPGLQNTSISPFAADVVERTGAGGVDDLRASASASVDVLTNDRDGDGVEDAVDIAPDDPFRCSDVDFDAADGLCDDCSQAGRFDPANDGVDSDEDGLCDAGERLRGTDPNDADSDDDGLTDGADPGAGVAFFEDLDGDGLGHALDPDSDNDGILDGTEAGLTEAGADTDITRGRFRRDEDPDTTTDPLRADTDGGGATDGSEDIDRNGRFDAASEQDPNEVNDDGDVSDVDGDGLGDALERQLRLDPQDADTDDDGLVDGREPNPSLDHDGDGLTSALDPDSDDDLLFDGTEEGVAIRPDATNPKARHFEADRDPSRTTFVLVADTDGDDRPDGHEDANGNGAPDDMLDPLDPEDVGAPATDTDEDGLPDDVEARLRTDPEDDDTDDDGVPDGEEPNAIGDVDGDGRIGAADPDADSDGLPDGLELGRDQPSSGTDEPRGFFRADLDTTTKTFATLRDSDGDGVTDANEDWNRDGAYDAGQETDPEDASSVAAPVDDDGDGLDDRLEAALDGDLLGDGDADDDGVLDGDEPDFAIDVDSDGAIDALDPDSDDDGLFDGTELGRTATTTDTDLSRGRFRPDNDPETTFPLVEDSDLGGVADGMEDMNGNGRIDDGETNPNDPTDDERSDSSRDADGDGLPDDVDNCPSDPNPDQADLDQDGRGDACDSDADGDGFDDDLSLRGSGCRSGGTPSGWGLWWAGLLVFVAARRRRILLAALFLVVGPAPAAAQTETTNFSLERFRLAADGQGFLDVEGAEVLPHLEVSASAWLGYEQNPLVLARDGEPVGALVEQRVAGEVSAALGLFGFASVGVVVPFAAIQERETVQVGVNGPLGALGGGLADIRIVPKLRVLTESDAGIGLSFLPALTVPGSGDSSYLGEGNLTFTPELALGRSLGPVRLGLNLGYRFRPRRRFLGVVVDDEITARLSVGTRLAPLDVGITGALAARADAPFESEGETAAEILAGVRGPLLSSLYLFGAGGVGLLDGYGTPELRALLGLRWLSPREESVPPLEGPAALDFSADPDGDEVIALDDLCPDEPGLVILDGCPNHDRDADGLLVVNDECPEVAEDMDGFEDTDGCPDLDDDRDLTPDVEDACPRVAGPRSHRGCPVRDSDGDGVPDAIDNCPGTSGLAGRSGCPRAQPVALREDRIDLLVPLRFRAQQRPNRATQATFRRVAEVLLEHPEIERLDIRVTSGPDLPEARAQARAEALKSVLIRAGVSPDRIGTGVTQTVGSEASSGPISLVLTRQEASSASPPAPR